ncbi:MAG TPA: hemerythrin domain-containing protein [Pseudomonadales bacterium]|nr:hemerythrin domain-containing protein [Pseudomonadales bacterium]HMV72232.1 hemerythrin domain-containing protein [Pseudomonadales bacterium]HNC69571.1 hemerythrin domain-containing protein [Pseudomonadales bacterium]
MSGIRNLMTDDHRHCDDLFASAEQAIGRGEVDAAREAFTRFHAGMIAHFNSEETTLFPSFEEHTGMSGGPTQVMRMEHQRMRILMDEAAETLAAGRVDDYLGVAETLLIMMQQHNMKEENILYPMCDQHLGNDGGVLEQRLASEIGVS